MLTRPMLTLSLLLACGHCGHGVTLPKDTDMPFSTMGCFVASYVIPADLALSNSVTHEVPPGESFGHLRSCLLDVNETLHLWCSRGLQRAEVDSKQQFQWEIITLTSHVHLTCHAMSAPQVFPFSSERKSMSVVVSQGPPLPWGGAAAGVVPGRAYVKGAPEILLDKCKLQVGARERARGYKAAPAWASCALRLWCLSLLAMAVGCGSMAEY